MRYRIRVIESQTLDYIVEADSEEEAHDKVHNSPDCPDPVKEYRDTVTEGIYEEDTSNE